MCAYTYIHCILGYTMGYWFCYECSEWDPFRGFCFENNFWATPGCWFTDLLPSELGAAVWTSSCRPCTDAESPQPGTLGCYTMK